MELLIESVFQFQALGVLLKLFSTKIINWFKRKKWVENRICTLHRIKFKEKTKLVLKFYLSLNLLLAMCLILLKLTFNVKKLYDHINII